MRQIPLDMPLGRLATEIPAASRVFQRHNLDFCCGGKKALDRACAEAGLDPAALAAEIEAEARASGAEVRWDQRPIDDLIDHILARYHAPLPAELEALQAMANRVARVHGGKDGRLSPLAVVIAELAEELMTHMAKEEQILFPWLRTPNARIATGPIAVMHRDHEHAAAQLAELRTLTDDYVVPPGACNTWTALLLRLAELDRELREHMHLENNVLFPRALNEPR